MLGNDTLRRAMQAATITGELALWCVIGLWFGSWLDRKLGTEPWLFLLFTLLGFALGLLRLFQGIQRLQGEDDDSADDPP